MADGVGIIDFGAFPGSLHAVVTISGQTGILATSKVEAWIRPEASADHSADEHMVEPIKLFVPQAEIVAGASFNVHGFYAGEHPQDERPGIRHPSFPNRNSPMAYGKYNFNYAGNYT